MATVKKTAKKTDVQINVPSAIRPDAAPVSAAGLLSALTGGTKAVPKAEKKKERPGLPLTPVAKDLFSQFVPAKIVCDHFTANLDNIKAALKGELFGLWTEGLWAQKSQPANPRLSVDVDGKPDLDGIYIIQAKFQVNANSREEAIAFLSGQGFSDAKAVAFVDGELDFDPIQSIRNFYELLKGHKADGGWVVATDAEQAVAVRIMQLLLGQSDTPLTEDERNLAITVIPNVKVRDGFLNRVTGYCETKEQLQAGLALIMPVAYPKSAKFGISDTMEQRTARLQQIATDILGEQLTNNSEEGEE